MLKSKLRKKILKIREKNNKKNIQIDFNQIIKILKKKNLIKKSDIIIIGVPHKQYIKIKFPKNKKIIDIWGIKNK